MPIHGFAVYEKGSLLEPITWDPAPLAEDEVEVQVQYCGVCHSDASMIRNEWGVTHYPLVPGHEVIGIVGKTGSGVKDLKPGQRVGIGWQSRSCGTCEDCRRGDDIFCVVDGQRTIIHGKGGFAEAIRIHNRFAIPIPEGLDGGVAAPLMCAGITVFSPFVDFEISPCMRVGVIGIGGLGHIALQVARAWGCEVTAFSGSADKEREAKLLGAHHFVNSRDAGALASLAGHFDFLLDTVSGNIDWAGFLATLRPRGNLVGVGVPDAPVTIPASILMSGQRRLSFSPAGSPNMIRKMLDFAHTFSVAPRVERFPFSAANEAIAKLDANALRYRAVLELTT